MVSSVELIILITIIFYLLSTVGYFAYLFWQKNYLQQTGYYLLAAGFLLHTMAIAYGFIQSGQIPVKNLFETLSMACWASAGVFLILQYKLKLKILGIYAAPLLTIVMALASRLPKEPVQVENIYKSLWFIVHIIAVFIGEASFALACGVGFLYLVQEHAIKTKHHGFFFRRLPSLELLDSTGYGCIIAGFTMLSLGLVTGFVYAKSVWGKFWSWDPKEVWAGITWLLYAALLHQRLIAGWRGRRAAVMAIIGFAAVLFTFFGVNFLLKGHHGEFTRW
jgi:cytochrome c-type biogenesis protein CcsB